MTNQIFSDLPTRKPPTSDGYENTLDEYPEINFRSLEKSRKGESIQTDYLTHSLQKHPATFIPQIPSYLIAEYAPDEGGVVLDIFGGSGTTGVEAVRQGHEYIGVEVNPLSKLISDVSTHPLPKSLLDEVFELFNSLSIDESKDELSFPGRTQKTFWFEDAACEDLELLRNKLFLLKQELEDVCISDEIINKTVYSENEMREQVWELFVLVFSNVVFETSNADPGVSKAYKSPIMKEAISEGDHPPDVHSTFKTQFEKVSKQVDKFWCTVLENTDTVPKSTTHFGDARSIDNINKADVAISSPPYINAINYYRGSKLRLFWIADMLSEMSMSFNASDLRKSIIGSNSGASLRDIDSEMLPFYLETEWNCEAARYKTLSLPDLDEQIENIMSVDISDSEKKSYLVWKFFAEDMVQSMSRVYDGLKDNGKFFFVIGENVVGGEFIETRRYLCDIGSHLGCFESSHLQIGEEFTHLGTAFDEITNRELFQSRNHDGGVIECEWVLAFEK